MLRCRTSFKLCGLAGRLASARFYAAEPARDESLIDILAHGLEDIKAAGTYKKEFPITSPQGPVIRTHMAWCISVDDEEYDLEMMAFRTHDLIMTQALKEFQKMS